MYNNWNLSKKEDELVLKIAQRAAKELNCTDVQATVMDLTCVHLNCCVLNLPKLLSSPLEELEHDITGISDHLDRGEGVLTRLFQPRCALSSVATDQQALSHMAQIKERQKEWQHALSEATQMLQDLKDTGVWTPVAQAELDLGKFYFVRRTSRPFDIAAARWTDIGWDVKGDTPRFTLVNDPLEVLL